MGSRRTPTLLVAGTLLLAGCNLAPPYKAPPTTETPAVYKEAGDWQTATPQDTLERGPWWEIYGGRDFE